MQAFVECESEWATHSAKACIDTTKKKLKGSIPENFPYVNVEFGISGGYVHVIDVSCFAVQVFLNFFVPQLICASIIL